MDTLHNLGIAFALLGGALWNILSAFGVAVYTEAQPALATLVPLALTFLAQRFIRNQTYAKIVARTASEAYLQMGALFATPGAKTNFSIARQVAVATAVASLEELAKEKLGGKSTAELRADVSGQLGLLLAGDPAFKVTDPHGVVPQVTVSPVVNVTQPVPQSLAAATALGVNQVAPQLGQLGGQALDTVTAIAAANSAAVR